MGIYEMHNPGEMNREEDTAKLLQVMFEMKQQNSKMLELLTEMKLRNELSALNKQCVLGLAVVFCMLGLFLALLAKIK